MKDKNEVIAILPTDEIIEIGVDEKEQLYIKPSRQTFEYIYRAAAEVGWDSKQKVLYSPKPREWSYVTWYRHIIAIAKEEYGCVLQLTDKTQWVNIPDELKRQIAKT